MSAPHTALLCIALLFALYPTSRDAEAADVCPLEVAPLPHAAWRDDQAASAEELYWRIRDGLRHWSSDPGFNLRLQDSLLELIRREPDRARGYVELARFAMIVGTTARYTLADETYDFVSAALERALTLEPGFAPGWALEALFRLHHDASSSYPGGLDEAEDALEEAERLDPDSSDVAFAWATLHALRFEHEAAIERMRSLLGQDGLSDAVAAAAYRRLGEYFPFVGRQRDALLAAEQAIARERYDPRNLLLYSSLALEQRADVDSAIVSARLAFCLRPTAEANRKLAYALYAAWALDNELRAEPRLEDDLLAEALERHPHLRDVMGYISEHARLAPLVDVLVRVGFSVDTEDPHDGSTALQDAVRSGRIEDAAHLIDMGADVNRTTLLNQSLLIEAAFRRDLEMARMLLSHGADVNARAQVGTPLIVAVMAGDEAMAQLLIEAGADLELTNESGETALTIAAFDPRDPERMLRLLLAAGADPLHQYPPGQPLVDTIAALGPPEVARLLRDAAERTAD